MDSLLIESELLLYLNPEKSQLINNYIFNESTEASAKIEALLLESQTFLLKQEYNNALSKIQQAHNLLGTDTNSENNLILIFYTGILYHELQLSNQAEELIGSTENSIINSKGNKLNILLRLSQAQNTDVSKEKQLDLLYDAKEVLTTDSNLKNPFLDTKTAYALAQYFFKEKQLDSATVHFNKFYNSVNSASPKDYYYFLASNKLGEIALLQNNTDRAKELLELNLNETKFGKRIFIENFKLLSQIYYAEEDLEKFAFYQKMYIDNLESQTRDLQEARVNAVNFYVTIQDNYLDTKQSSFQFKFILFCSVLMLVIGLLLFYYFKAIRKSKNQLLVIKSKNELEKAIFEIEERVAKENITTTYTIPEKTEQAILEKLTAFEKSLLFTDASLSMQSLADRLNTNTKYLSDIINNKKNKNFRTYINELRIEYITQKLKTNPEYLNYKTSYLAKEAGFKSRSSFTVIFKNVMGVSPSEFIEKLRNDKQ